MRDEMVDFPKFGHIYALNIIFHIYSSWQLSQASSWLVCIRCMCGLVAKLS